MSPGVFIIGILSTSSIEASPLINAFNVANSFRIFICDAFLVNKHFHSRVALPHLLKWH